LAFVADFETRNFNFKNKFDMENNTSTKHENGNDANRLLAAVNFDAIHNAISNFVIANNRRPTLIAMHPADGEKFIELLYKEYGYCAMQNLMNYRGMKLLRSFDVEEGKWSLY
jgi:hypothetical protein